MTIIVPIVVVHFAIWALPLILAMIVMSFAPSEMAGCAWFLVVFAFVLCWYAFAFWRFS